MYVDITHKGQVYDSIRTVLGVQDSSPLRADKMAMLPLVCTFLLKLERIFSCVCHA